MKYINENQMPDSDNYFEINSGDSFPDLTPLIDVVFLLIVFFLLTSIMGEKTLSINLPSSSSAEAAPIENIVIEIDKDNNIFYQTQKTDFDKITTILSETKQKTNSAIPSIIIRSDEKTSFGIIIRLIDIIQKEGYDSILFSVKEIDE